MTTNNSSSSMSGFHRPATPWPIVGALPETEFRFFAPSRNLPMRAQEVYRGRAITMPSQKPGIFHRLCRRWRSLRHKDAKTQKGSSWSSKTATNHSSNHRAERQAYICHRSLSFRTSDAQPSQRSSPQSRPETYLRSSRSAPVTVTLTRRPSALRSPSSLLIPSPTPLRPTPTQALSFLSSHSPSPPDTIPASLEPASPPIPPTHSPLFTQLLNSIHNQSTVLAPVPPRPHTPYRPHKASHKRNISSTSSAPTIHLPQSPPAGPSFPNQSTIPELSHSSSSSGFSPASYPPSLNTIAHLLLHYRPRYAAAISLDRQRAMRDWWPVMDYLNRWYSVLRPKDENGDFIPCLPPLDDQQVSDLREAELLACPVTVEELDRWLRSGGKEGSNGGVDMGAAGVDRLSLGQISGAEGWAQGVVGRVLGVEEAEGYALEGVKERWVEGGVEVGEWLDGVMSDIDRKGKLSC